MRKILLLITLALPLVGKTQEKNSVSLDKTTLFLIKMDSTHRADSIRRLKLLQEIENLKGSEVNKQKEKLLKQLAEVKMRDSIKRQTQLRQVEELKLSAKGFPVAPFTDTLFLIYTRMGSFSAKDRAAAIIAKIERLYDDYEFQPDSLRLNLTESSPEIIYHDLMVMSVNELEALWYNKKPEALAQEYCTRIQKAIKQERKTNNVLNIGLRIGAIVLILAGIYVVIVLINKLHRRVNKKIVGLKDRLLRGIKFRGYQFLDSKRQVQVIMFISNIFRLMIIILALYIALPLLFSVFPWTRGIAETLISWIVNPLKNAGSGLIHYLPNLFSIMVIIAISHYVVKFLKFIAGEIENESLKLPGFYPDWAKPTLNIVKFLLYAFSFVIIFPYLPGSNSPVFQGVSVFVGVLFSLGSSSAISNAVAGLVITYMRPFRVGDRIKIGELSGDVMEKSVLVTRIRTIKNENITIPNSSILAGHVINYTTSAKDVGLILNTSVTIGYDAPWKKVHELLNSAAISTKGILNDETHKPFVLQTSLDDFYVAYQINAYTVEPHRMASIYSELHQNIQDKFNEGGIEILSPHYRAARDGNKITIPTEYLAKDYKAPLFNIEVSNTPPDKKNDE